MIKSSPILPLRIYDDLFDQQRFNAHCSNAKQADLVYPTNELPFFQFRRTSSLTEPNKLLLKNVCKDHSFNGGGDVTRSFFKEIPEPASNFSNYASEEFYDNFLPELGGIYDDGVDPPFGGFAPIAKVDSCGLSNIDDPGFWTFNAPPSSSFFSFGISSSSNLFHFKMIVEKFVAQNDFKIKIWNGDVGDSFMYEITGPGIYNFRFLSFYNKVTIEFVDWEFGDIFNISYMQCERVDIHEESGQHEELDETELKVISMQDGEDIIVYCETGQAYNLPPGEYYFVIVDGENYYFSEVFKLVTLKEIERYYKLQWHNNFCDINNSVIYQPIGCTYINVLYLSAALFKPEPETKDDGEENEEGDYTVKLQTWKKNINFEIPKCPEFLTDALSAVFMHSYISLRKPLNTFQEETTNEFLVKRIISDISSVLQDCFQKVNLKLLLFDNFTKAGCCSEAETYACDPCDYTAGDNDCSGQDYNLVITNPPDPEDGLYACDGMILVHVSETDIICVGGKYKTLVNVGTEGAPEYQLGSVAPEIVAVALNGSNYDIQGQALPYSFAVVQYNNNGAGWVTHGTIQADSTGAFLYELPTSTAVGATDFDVRFQMKTYACDFGFSDAEDVI